MTAEKNSKRIEELEDLVREKEETIQFLQKKESVRNDIVKHTSLKGRINKMLDYLVFDMRAIYLTNHDKTILECRGIKSNTTNETRKNFEELEIPIEGNLREILFGEGEYKQKSLNGLLQDALEPLGDKDILSYSGAPLRHDGLTNGLIVVGTSQLPFRKYHLKFLYGNAPIFALAVNNVRNYEKSQEEAIRDGLTGAYNHRHFQERLKTIVENSGDDDIVSLIFMDVDNFKDYNDQFGHPAGDKVLKKIAKITEISVGKEYLVARWGGEEFAVILDDVEKESAIEKAEKLRGAIDNNYFEGQERLHSGNVTVSIGVATLPRDATNSLTLMDKVDKALYKAKKTDGKNIVVPYDKTM